MNVEALATVAIDCGFKLRSQLGPGLLESACEVLMAHSFIKRGVAVERQRSVPIVHNGVAVDEGFRLDLLVEGKLLIELKSVERLAPVHGKQVPTYLRLMNLSLAAVCAIIFAIQLKTGELGLHRAPEANRQATRATDPGRYWAFVVGLAVVTIAMFGEAIYRSFG